MSAGVHDLRRRWLVPRWLAELLSPTPGCECETCAAIRENYVRLDTLLQIAPKAIRRERQA